MKKFFKRIYELVPFKREFFSILKTVWTPQENIYRHLHFVGVFKVPVDNSKIFKIKHYGYRVENEIF